MRRILITGASRGIGRAIAVKLAAAESHFILHGRNRSGLKETAKQVADAGGKSTIIESDLSELSGIESLIAQSGPEPIDILVNNAGMTVVRDAVDLSHEDWQKSFMVNVTAPFMLAKALVPSMKRGSSIVNILSTAATRPFTSWSAYCMSKFALNGFSLTLREELRPKGIRVINIYPAATATEIWEGLPGEWDRKRMMAPEEVADAVAFALALPENTQVENLTFGNVGGSL